MRTRNSTKALLLAAAVALAVGFAPKGASAHTMLVCFPGGPGSTNDAVERLTTFFARLKTVSGLDVQGEYHNTKEACDRYLSTAKPTIAMFPYSDFLARAEALHLVPVAQVVRQGRADNRYYIVGKKGQTLADLKGKALMTAHGAELDVISNVGFGDKVNLRKDFTVRDASTSLRAIKALAKGQTDAILLDSNEWKSLQTLPSASEMEAALTSEPLPGQPVVVMGEGAAVAQKLRESLPKVCEDKKACEAIEVERILPADASTYKEMVESAAKP